MQLQSRMDNVVRIAGMGTNDYWKGFGYFTGAIETRYSSFLAAVKHTQGWDGGCV